MQIIIYSPYDCLVKQDQEEKVLDHNEHLILPLSDKPIEIYPINKNSQYSFLINLDEKTSSFYSIIEKDGDILVFLMDGIIANNIDIFSFKNRSSVEVEKNKITFSTDKHKKVLFLPFSPQKVECGNFDYINYARFKDGKKSYLIAYNTRTNKSKLFQGDDIKVNENGFVVTNMKNTFYNQTTMEYIFDEGIKIKSKVFSKNTNIPQELVTFNFVTCLKLKDYQNALSLLSESLQNTVNEESLKKYFGEITYFYMIDQTTCFALSNGKNKLFRFNIEQNKISEISDSE